MSDNMKALWEKYLLLKAKREACERSLQHARRTESEALEALAHEARKEMR